MHYGSGSVSLRVLTRPTDHHFLNGTSARLQLLRSNSLSGTELTLQYLNNQTKPASLFKHNNSDAGVKFYPPSLEVLDISTLSFCYYPLLNQVSLLHHTIARSNCAKGGT